MATQRILQANEFFFKDFLMEISDQSPKSCQLRELIFVKTKISLIAIWNHILHVPNDVNREESESEVSFMEEMDFKGRRKGSDMV
jgi:hypothetical protein